MLGALGLVLAFLAWSPLVQAHEVAHEQRLPTIGAAPDFALISQDGAEVTFEDFVAVTLSAIGSMRRSSVTTSSAS